MNGRIRSLLGGLVIAAGVGLAGCSADLTGAWNGEIDSDAFGIGLPMALWLEQGNQVYAGEGAIWGFTCAITGSEPDVFADCAVDFTLRVTEPEMGETELSMSGDDCWLTLQWETSSEQVEYPDLCEFDDVTWDGERTMSGEWQDGVFTVSREGDTG